VVARSRARDALTALAGLVEAAVDVHERELATHVGRLTTDAAGPLDHDTGDEMSALFRKAD
jgi:hypothetical protein